MQCLIMCPLSITVKANTDVSYAAPNVSLSHIALWYLDHFERMNLQQHSTVEYIRRYF